MTAVSVGGVRIVLNLWRMTQLPIPDLLVQTAVVASYIHGYGLFLITVFVVGYICSGWQGVIAYFLGVAVAGMVSSCVSIRHTSRVQQELGIPFTTSEIGFLSAYRHLARRLRRSGDVSVGEDEIKSNRWKQSLNQFAHQWPEVVRRFTNEV